MQFSETICIIAHQKVHHQGTCAHLGYPPGTYTLTHTIADTSPLSAGLYHLDVSPSSNKASVLSAAITERWLGGATQLGAREFRTTSAGPPPGNSDQGKQAKGADRSHGCTTNTEGLPRVTVGPESVALGFSDRRTAPLLRCLYRRHVLSAWQQASGIIFMFGCSAAMPPRVLGSSSPAPVLNHVAKWKAHSVWEHAL